MTTLVLGAGVVGNSVAVDAAHALPLDGGHS